MSSSSPRLASDTTAKCPSCGAVTSGKFCSECGASLAGAVCGSCNAPLSAGARFCHRCGTAVGAEPIVAQRGLSSALPWAVAAIALVALIALAAGQRFARSSNDPATVSGGGVPLAGGGDRAQPPDLSTLTPGDAARRLYNRVMSAHERGITDSVQLFAPMAIAAYQMIGNLDLDQRYDVGRIAAVSGDEEVARAQADTILTLHPNHLLGLILAGDAARLRKDATAERAYLDKLRAAAPSERLKQLPEYAEHGNDIAIALDSKRR